VTAPTYGSSPVPPEDIVARIDELIPRDGTGMPMAWVTRSVHTSILLAARNEIARLRARIQKLECALQPLADLYLWPDDLGEEASRAIKSDANWCESSNADADVSEGLRRGHIHAARLVLKELS